MKMIKKIIFYLLSVIFFLLTYELFLRVTEIATPSFVYDDKQLGRTFKPNSDVIFKGAEGFYMGKVNSFGYLGKEYPPTKIDGSVRIALLGDSYIEGMQLFERNHFKTILEKDLSDSLKKKIEFLNFGIGGIDFRDMFFNYTHKAKNFNPDYVLFYVKKSNLLNKEKFPSPEYYLEGDTLKLEYSFLKSEESSLRQRFAFVRDFALGYLLKETYENYYNGLLLTKISNGLWENEKKNKGKKESVKNDKTEELFNLNKKIFETLEQESKETGTVFILLITDDFPEEYYPLLNNYEKIIKIILPAELNDYKNKEYRYWKASGMLGHWNQMAHRKVAEFLKPFFIRIITENEKNKNNFSTRLVN